MGTRPKKLALRFIRQIAVANEVRDLPDRELLSRLLSSSRPIWQTTAPKRFVPIVPA